MSGGLTDALRGGVMVRRRPLLSKMRHSAICRWALSKLLGVV